MHEHLAESIAIGEAQSIHLVQMILGPMRTGFCHLLSGEPHEALDKIQQGLSVWESLGGKLIVPCLKCLIAQAYGLTQQVNAGLQVIDEAIALVEATGERMYEPELYRVKGELWLSSEPRDDMAAEQLFRKALDSAGAQQAKSLELRAAVSLARLWHHQGKCNEAHELLAPIYNWFTEGFDTADLQEAKILLEELV